LKVKPSNGARRRPGSTKKEKWTLVNVHEKKLIKKNSPEPYLRCPGPTKNNLYHGLHHRHHCGLCPYSCQNQYHLNRYPCQNRCQCRYLRHHLCPHLIFILINDRIYIIFRFFFIRIRIQCHLSQRHRGNPQNQVLFRWQLQFLSFVIIDDHDQLNLSCYLNHPSSIPFFQTGDVDVT
jgi:hypothetical protein